MVGEFREIFNLYLGSNSQDFDHDHCQNSNFSWSNCQNGQLEI